MINYRNIFALLDQNGPFRVEEELGDGRTFTPRTRHHWRQLRQAGLIPKYRITRDQICQLLDVQGLHEISALLTDSQRRAQIESRAYRLLGNMFGIDGNEREIISRINSYSRIADGVINYLRAKVLANYAPYIEMTNEIDSTRNPVDLLLILFDDRYHRKARFEAQRKLVLMNLAGAIDQRERETEVEHKFLRFLNFLNAEVWSHKAKIGELDIVYLHSRHDLKDFSCREVEVKHREELPTACGPGEKVTMIKRRCFPWRDREIPVYVSIRKKPPEAKVLKLLRKGEENPAVAVDDELGLMAVVDSHHEVKIFQQHLTASAARAGSLLTLEDMNNTLVGGNHQSSSPAVRPRPKCANSSPAWEVCVWNSSSTPIALISTIFISKGYPTTNTRLKGSLIPESPPYSFQTIYMKSISPKNGMICCNGFASGSKTFKPAAPSWRPRKRGDGMSKNLFGVITVCAAGENLVVLLPAIFPGKQYGSSSTTGNHGKRSPEPVIPCRRWYDRPFLRNGETNNVSFKCHQFGGIYFGDGCRHGPGHHEGRTRRLGAGRYPERPGGRV
ncbi:MAG: hypothetical protein U5J62_10565 [Desulfurivibrio sp.]|nr:hypothetical protein [Desulfurivibrio sp.]